MPIPVPDTSPGPSEPLADEEIVQRVRAGQRDLYELLMRRNNQRIYRAIRTVLRDESEIEDVMQQAYVSAYLHLDQFAGLARFSTWLVRIALNEAINRRRQAPRLVLIEDSLEEADVAMNQMAGGRTPEQEAAERELVYLVEEAVDGLPEMYRQVLVLREIEGMNTAEVAEALAISEDVVKTRLHRARALLQEKVDARDGDLGAAFSFDAGRCDRVVAGVMTTLSAEPH